MSGQTEENGNAKMLNEMSPLVLENVFEAAGFWKENENECCTLYVFKQPKPSAQSWSAALVHSFGMATAMRKAIDGCKPDILEAILELKIEDEGEPIATANLKEPDGDYPLILAARAVKRDKNTIRDEDEEDASRMVQILLDHGAYVDVRCQHSALTALMIFAINGFINQVYEMIQYGADLEALDDHEGFIPGKRRPEAHTALGLAAFNGKFRMVKFLIDVDAKVECDEEWLWSTSPLWAALDYRYRFMRNRNRNSLNIINYLILNGADIENYDDEGYTPFCLAASEGDIQLLRLLAGHGSEIERGNDQGDTPLMIAVKKGHLDVVQFLINSGADIGGPDDGSYGPLAMASEAGHVDVVHCLLNAGADHHELVLDTVLAGDENWKYPIQIAYDAGNFEVVKILIDLEDQPLHFAACHGYHEIVATLLQESLLSVPNDDGMPPLHLAVEYGHPEIVKLLLDARADQDLLDDHGHSPLHYAMENKNLKKDFSSEIFEMLIAAKQYETVSDLNS
jgi:ankyrin repeat protein